MVSGKEISNEIALKFEKANLKEFRRLQQVQYAKINEILSLIDIYVSDDNEKGILYSKIQEL